MKKINEIDAFAFGRKPPSNQERKKIRVERLEQEKEDGYQQLSELCALGEIDAARILANKNYRWGYQIIGREVMQRED